MDRETFAKGLQFIPINKTNKRSSARYYAKQQVQGEVKPRRNTKRMKKLLMTVELTGLIAMGSIKGFQLYQEQTQMINLQQALQMGKDIESLGLTPELVEKIETMGTILEEPETLSNAELIEIAQEVRELQEEVIDTKVQALTGIEDVELKGLDDDNLYSIKIGDTVYLQKDLFNPGVKEMSANITSYVKSYNEYRFNIFEMNYKNLYRDEYIEKVTKQMEKIEKFAAGEMLIDEKGNIKMEQTRKKEYEDMFREKQAEQEER